MKVRICLKTLRLGEQLLPLLPPAGALPAEWQHYIEEGSNADDT